MDFKSLIGGTAFLILGCLVCVGASALGLGRFSKPGPGFIFFLAGSVMVVLSVVDIIKGLYSKESGIRNLLALWQAVNWGKAAFLFIGTIMYVLLLDALGILLPTPFYIGFCVRLLGLKKWVVTVSAAIFSTLAFYLLVRFLDIPIDPLPKF